ncbi:ABC transporter substrate-binding protein [Bacillus mycoides]|uniref:ABC transporter substrate-binding protein n=1 Tax=Bacillus mycoides TaxID=1405 RepID=UPI003D25A22E
MKIFLDDSPKESIPFKVRDYSSCLLCSAMYEPLFLKINNEFTENLIIDNTQNTNIALTFKEFYWSNGERCTPEDLKKTLFYIIENKLPLAQYIDFIEGVKDYLDGDIDDLKNIKISTNSDTIYIKSLTNSDYYKHVFSTIYFSPVKFIKGLPSSNIVYGPFQMEMENNWMVLERNPYYEKNICEMLEFKVEKDPLINILNFNGGNLDVTSTTILYQKYRKQLIKNKNFRQKKSNLSLRIEFSEFFLNQKNNLVNSIYELIENDEYLKNDIVSSIKKVNSGKYDGVKHDKLTVLYSDYYPNNILANKIGSFYKERNVNVKLKHGDLDYFMEEYSKSNYDICINVAYPITQNKVDYYIEKIDFLPESRIDCYIDLLNKWIDGKIDEYLLDEYLDKFALFVTIGDLNHHFLISNSMEGFIIDDNDNFIFKFLEGK